ncbi:MAG: hypothetical protein GX131_12395 [candidate division WS1 bacterium]|jgi:hypothetical protein|nr:hypothetical protein [candidate division WS1 bacterium]
MPADALYTFSLTVAEGKRLIGRGVAALPQVRRALSDGIIVVTRSTTSGYVLEELLGAKIDRRSFVTGKTLPSGHPERGKLLSADTPEVVIRRGQRGEGDEGLIGELSAGDVVIKSPNALDYDGGMVGYLIGASDGGTVGKYLGPCHGKHLHFVAPCGLEKQVAGDLVEASLLLTEAGAKLRGPSLWVTPAEIMTELDAIALLTGAEAVQIAAGGIMGAEGAAWITAFGSEEQVGAVRSLVEEIQGEPEMLEYATQPGD